MARRDDRHRVRIATVRAGDLGDGPRSLRTAGLRSNRGVDEIARSPREETHSGPYPSTASESMTIQEAQRELRQAYLGGFAGGLVAGGIWLASAALGTWSTKRAAILMLVVGGMFIYPLTVL